MKMFTSLLLVVLLAASCLTASAQSFPPQGWANHRIVTISNTGPQLKDYQVRIDLNASSFDFSEAKADGSDIRITSGQSDAPVPFWIERWDPTDQSARVWARVPLVASTGQTQTTLRLYYGNPAALSASNGNAAFLFFDDFTAQGYFKLSSPAKTVLRRDQAFEVTAPHTLSVIKLNQADVDGYSYWGYYGPSYWMTEDNKNVYDDKGWIGFARSKDLVNWVKESAPLFGGESERWPSVLLVNNKFYMAHTKDYATTPKIVLRTSTDGKNFGPATTLVEQGSNPALFKDPTDGGQFYLYWFLANKIKVKKAPSIEGLLSAPTSTVMVSPNTLAAPQVMYYDGTYYLAVETLNADNRGPDGSVWFTLVFASSDPISGFTLLPGNPLLGDGTACFFQHIFGNTLHAYYCKQAPPSTSAPPAQGLTWTVDYRTADLRAERERVPILDPAKWVIPPPTRAPTPTPFPLWQLLPVTEKQNSFPGAVLQGSMTATQILQTRYTGNDYIVEASGRQISGRVWGIGVRTLDPANLYSVNLYTKPAPNTTENLYVYRWGGGPYATELKKATVSPFLTGVWQKLAVKVYGSTIEVYVNDQKKLQATDPQSTFPSGAVALYGEKGTTAQFSNVFVRKYTTSEPIASVSPEQ